MVTAFGKRVRFGLKLAGLLTAVAFGIACKAFLDPGPNVPDWSWADQAGNSSENQHGFMMRRPTDAGVDAAPR